MKVAHRSLVSSFPACVPVRRASCTTGCSFQNMCLVFESRLAERWQLTKIPPNAYSSREVLMPNDNVSSSPTPLLCHQASTGTKFCIYQSPHLHECFECTHYRSGSQDSCSCHLQCWAPLPCPCMEAALPFPISLSIVHCYKTLLTAPMRCASMRCALCDHLHGLKKETPQT